MSDFDYETYKRIKKNTINNVGIFSNLRPGQKLNFNSADGAFTAATNAERTQSNRNQAVADKQSATSLHNYKYPIIAFFYELNRIRIKKLTGKDVKNSQGITDIRETIKNCFAGLTRLKETYEGEQRGLLTRIFNSKTDQINNTRAILDVVNMMIQADTYAHLNTIYIKNVSFSSPQRYVAMMAKVHNNTDIGEHIRNACTSETDVISQYFYIGQAASWLYSNIYSGGSRAFNIEIKKMREYFIELHNALKPNPSFIWIQYQTSGLIFDPSMKGAHDPIYGYLYKFDSKKNKQIANDVEFKEHDFLHCYHRIKARYSNCRIYANIKNTQHDHVEAMKKLSGYLSAKGNDGEQRFSHVFYFKIASLNYRRDDTLCIYVDEYKTAMDWAAGIAEILRPHTNPTVAGFQGQPFKNIGVGIGAEPNIRPMNEQIKKEDYSRSITRYASRLSEHNTGKFLRAPKAFIGDNQQNPQFFINPEGFSYGTYISSVLAVGLARAAKNNNNIIPTLEKCTPYFAQTCAEYGIDYMKPHKPQEIIDNITKAEHTYGENLLEGWKLQ